ncbi:hypothetical protein Pan153_56450 [Gimesia panareensis]|uniref:Uncharacterized protein n=1 Tax=Gimesia panareensis TaxID=2527978 RepID=A0A518FX50_9PLAN|nr:hypothetical protein [Gimesia panareensis]QDV20965.1 hypothetical protein Pan153_56450 [Gimesia panareensis]
MAENNKITVDHPLLERLRELDRKLGDSDILGDIGLYIGHENEPGFYEDSPQEAIAFASTGGDGDHYSLIAIEGAVTERSPVVLTWPPEGENIVVAPDLETFLRVGLHCGFFVYLEVRDPEIVGEGDDWFADFLDEEQKEALQRLARELNLTPLPAEAMQFEELNQQYADRFHNSVNKTGRFTER